MTDETGLATIRRAERHDMTAIAAMAGEFHALLAAMDDSDPAFDIEATAAKLECSGFGSKPLFSALIAEINGDSIGYAIYSIGFWADSFEGMVWLTDLFVREAWRSRGVGGQLMRRLAATGRDEGCETVMWTVWTRNEAAQRFYEQLGAVPLADEQMMKWSISPSRPRDTC
jgi:GNAT superfamily N-acetyltransferase